MIERNKTNVALDGLFEQFLNLISEALTRYWRSRRILSTRLMPMLTV